MDNRGQESMFYADVKNTMAVNLITAVMSYDSGNNVNWIFSLMPYNYINKLAELNPNLIREYSALNSLFITDIIQHLDFFINIYTTSNLNNC
ncbi:MAG: hypothetical protein NC925_03140 [Candidatus Omnitrophica bacterium]|nr:hypothetical protein [Candidatus Omnitrophota bacterium]MCM8831923.1 hypothetical protein [Candidatus Omnitrophota bacterium]